MKTTYVIGITGGIAGGKTAVSDMLAKKGEQIIDADVISREVIEPGTKGERLLKEAFPEAFEGGSLDRGRLREIVFADEKKLQKLDEITHPLIREEIEKRIAETDREQVYLVVPLMFESGFDALCDYIVTVVSDEDKRIKRLKARNNSITDELAERIVHSQVSECERVTRADGVIVNNDSRERLEERVNEFYEEIKNRRK